MARTTHATDRRKSAAKRQAKPGSRGQSGRGRPAARATRAASAPPTELQRLRDTLGTLDTKATALGTPLHRIQDAIHMVRAPLDLPAKLMRGLDDAHTAMAAIRIVTTGLSWVPGPIGTGAKAADRALKPFVQAPPSPHGILRNARDMAAEIDRALKPVREAIDRLQGPVDRATAAVDSLEARLAFLATAVDRLLQHYGASPPPGVEACAAKLNAPLQVALDAILKLEPEAGRALDTLAKALLALLAGLQPLIDVAAKLDKALSALAAKPIRDVMAVMRKLVSALEPYRRWAEFFLKEVINTVLKKLGLSLAAIERFFDQLVDSINPLKPIATLLANARARIAALAEKLIAAAEIEEALERLQALQRQLEQEIDAFLKSACGGLMLPKTLPAGR